MKNPNNPYIKLVEQNPKILDNSEKIYLNKGKWQEFFKNDFSINLEIGTGMGNFFSYLCQKNPNQNFIGMELRFKRLEFTEKKAKNSGNENYIILKDFGQNIDKIFGENELTNTYIFFPDPYSNKSRQLKHRMVTADFLDKLAFITKKNGKLFFKTDHDEYFSWVLDILSKQKKWKLDFCSYDYHNDENFNTEEMTEFEAMYKGDKKNINYLEAINIG